MLPDALMPTFPAQTVLILCYNVLGFSKAYCYLWHMSILDMCWVEERCQLLLPATCYWLEHSKAAVFCLLIPSPFICPLFLPSLFSWLIVDEYQLWESKGRNILSSQRVVNVTSLRSILNFRISLFNCSFVYSPTHLFMYLGDGSHVDVRGQLAGAFSLLLPCSFWAQVKGCQAWWQRFLSAEMPLCPFAHICKILFYF